ncbi:hypothetical protein RJ55_04411 [Drechmeria coniospora]|nr:hypothetical protein RJ55_04411 [Drechmeria coniospora]
MQQGRREFAAIRQWKRKATKESMLAMEFAALAQYLHLHRRTGSQPAGAIDGHALHNMPQLLWAGTTDQSYDTCMYLLKYSCGGLRTACEPDYLPISSSDWPAAPEAGIMRVPFLVPLQIEQLGRSGTPLDRVWPCSAVFGWLVRSSAGPHQLSLPAPASAPPASSVHQTNLFCPHRFVVRRLWHQNCQDETKAPTRSYETTQRPPENENPASLLPPCLRIPPRPFQFSINAVAMCIIVIFVVDNGC